MAGIHKGILGLIDKTSEGKIKELILSDKNLGAIPPEIFDLEFLEVLDLSGNLLSTVPEDIGRLKKLKSLSLARNQLNALPKAIGFLENLEHINLYKNEFTEVPEAITHLQNLKWLFLGHNHLTKVPEAIGRLRNLKFLYLASNRLTKVTEAIGRLFNLKSLYLDGNQLTTIPETIVQLQNLSILILKGNPLEKPPPEVALMGLDAIRMYFRQIEVTGLEQLFEAKLLIVGEAGAGKTSLARKINNPAYELQDELSTRGIEVAPWNFPIADRRTFRVNIWDFGGQEIYHATHQFFLTKRSLYALVADTRKEDTDFYYWLNVVELLSDGSPLLIIKNEKQDRQREINERQLRGQFTNLKEILATNLFNNRGLDKVVSEIKHHIQQLSHVGTSLPKTWVGVREVLEKDPRNFMILEEYLTLCDNHGISNRQDKLQLSGYLHDLGVCLHFQDDPLLKHILILKPEWGTAAVYKVLDNPEVIGNLGRFTLADLAGIWTEPYYTDHQAELLQLMINFKLCYQIPGTQDIYIAPQLLSENQPEYAWDYTGNLILQYTYEFMPRGIITRFIVEMHRFIAGQNLVWRSGVVLDARDGTKAEVIEHYGKRDITIRVAGKHARDLMTIVSHELDKIHATYTRLKWSKLVPCNCEKCKNSDKPQFFDFQVLRKFYSDRQPQIQCQSSYQMVNVMRLIDNVLDRWHFLELERKKFGEARTNLFVSYSHKDSKWLKRLQNHLKPWERLGLIDLWDDTKIKPGMIWRREIEQAVGDAKIAILMISADFLASDFITIHELPPLLSKAKSEGCLILQIIISPCAILEELSQFQAVNSPEMPLIRMKKADQEEVFLKIAKTIKESLTDVDAGFIRGIIT